MIFIIFMWLIHPWDEWVLFSLIFCQCLVFDIFASICVPPNFLKFSWHSVGYGFGLSIGCQSDHFFIFILHWYVCYIYTPDHVFWFSVIFLVFSSSPYFYDVCDVVAPTQEHIHIHLLVLVRPKILGNSSRVMFIRVGLGICLPMGTHHVMNMGM